MEASGYAESSRMDGGRAEEEELVFFLGPCDRRREGKRGRRGRASPLSFFLPPQSDIWMAPEPCVIDVRPPSSCRPRRLSGGNGERIREILTLPLGERHSCLSTNASHFENPTLAARSGLIGEGGFPIPSPLPRSLLNDRERGGEAVEVVPRP